jgi:hypothetical protein
MVKFVIDSSLSPPHSFPLHFLLRTGLSPVVLINFAEITFLLWRRTGDGSKLLGCLLDAMEPRSL